jgi:hypothetical protein
VNLARAVDEKTACICYVGGDPSTQAAHAFRTSEIALKRANGRILRICFETNGRWNPDLLQRAGIQPRHLSPPVLSGGSARGQPKAGDSMSGGVYPRQTPWDCPSTLVQLKDPRTSWVMPVEADAGLGKRWLGIWKDAARSHSASHFRFRPGTEANGPRSTSSRLVSRLYRYQLALPSQAPTAVRTTSFLTALLF